VASELHSATVLGDAELSRRRERFARGATLGLDDLASARAPELLHELREVEPVSWIPELSGWLVTSHEVARTLLGPRQDVTVLSEQNMVRWSLGRMMLTVDAGEHERLRHPFEVPFRPREVDTRFRKRMLTLCADLLEPLRGSTLIDLDAQFCAPFAVRMAGELLGLELGESRRISDFYEAFADAMQYDENPARLARADKARVQLDALLVESIARASSSDTFLLETRERAKESLSDDEFIAQLRVIMFGAIETIRATLLNTVVLLNEHPGARDTVRSDAGRYPAAISEAQRLIPPVAFVERWAGRPLDLGGVAIGAGEFIGVSVVGVNRDPRVFTDPDSFRLDRSNSQRALSFSFGEHHCLGFHLARLQSTVAMESLDTYLGPYEVSAADEATGFAFRRPTTVWITPVT